MLRQRRRRWANISQALGPHILFDRLHDWLEKALDRRAEKNGAHSRSESNRQIKRTEVNQHVPNLCGRGGITRLLLTQKRRADIVFRVRFGSPNAVQDSNQFTEPILDAMS